MLIGYYGKDARWSIWRDEDREGKSVWLCACPMGKGYPVQLCRHLQQIFRKADMGEIPRELKLTREGKEAADECECRKRARAKNEHEARPVEEIPAKRAPCPCGSGHKFKKCHGAAVLPRDGAAWPGPLPLAEVRERLGLPPLPAPKAPKKAPPKAGKKAPAPPKAPKKAPPKAGKKAPAPPKAPKKAPPKGRR